MVFTGGCLSIAIDHHQRSQYVTSAADLQLALWHHGHESAFAQLIASTVRRVRSEARASRDDLLNFYRPNNLHQRTRSYL